LQKEKLVHETDWFWNYGVWLITSLAITLALFGTGIFALMKWFGNRQAERERREDEQKHLLEDRQAEREKRGEEHFQSVVEELGSTNQVAQVGAAITLRTFLRPGYEQFYRQSFDLAVAHLRLRHVDADTAEPLDSLSQALITLFKESFPHARQHVQNMQQLDTASIQLDNAYLAGADLEHVWMPQSYLRQTVLSRAHLSGANLRKANLHKANLRKADLRDADLSGTNLNGTNLNGANLNGARLNGANLNVARLSGANLSKAHLYGANLNEADLRDADLSGAHFNGTDLSGARLNKADLSGTNLDYAHLNKADLSGANLSGADLYGANLYGADLSGADLSGADLNGAHLQGASQFEKTKLQNVKGLTQEELETYKIKGAII
jgi:uncharacterized protein YjbI with pentapeptide repeats